MREIKFRAWAIASEQMFIPVADDGWDIDHGVLRPLPNTILMQYTGLKDKNGVEIYESDIISSRDDPSVVVWDDDHACYFYESPRWSKNQHGWHLDCDVACEVEVIGNVHANPDLLSS